MDLGGTRTSLSPIMTEWLREGRMREGSPTPSPDRAGSSAGSLEDRQAAVRDFLDSEQTAFFDDIVKQDTQSSVYSYPVSWEIREAVQTAIREIRDAVLNTKPDSSGV
jgi:hypothetical protein